MMKVIVAVLSLSLCGCGLALPEAKVSVKVVNEKGLRLEGGEITVTFEDNDGEIRKMGISNTNSLFQAQAKVTEPTVSVSVIKDGYYQSRISYMFKNRNPARTEMSPWNPIVTVVMREKADEKDMIHQFIDVRSVPAVGTPIGFDLKNEDWVAPYGKGIVSDFVFSAEQEGKWISSYTITFSNEGDGIQEYEIPEDMNSIYKWPYQAPVDGYSSVLKKVTRGNSDVIAQKKYPVKKNSEVNYIFRVRTELDEQGNVISALYGKILGELKIYAKGGVQFHYYLNTDQVSRSLESTNSAYP